MLGDLLKSAVCVIWEAGSDVVLRAESSAVLATSVFSWLVKKECMAVGAIGWEKRMGESSLTRRRSQGSRNIVLAEGLAHRCILWCCCLVFSDQKLDQQALSGKLAPPGLLKRLEVK